MMSSALIILALMMASGASVPVASRDRDAETLGTSPSLSDVGFVVESSKKFAHSADGSEEEANERDTAGESEREAPRVSATKDELYAKKGRKHKAFFHGNPFASQVQRYRKASSSGREAILRSHRAPTDKRKTGNKKTLQRESEIYYIRLPPTPYMYVPGLGYVSQPPTYSTAGLQRPPTSHVHKRPARPQSIYHKPSVNNFIKVPVDFVSNGKPTGVYQWHGSKRPDNKLNSLNDGPYAFNGKPTGLYLLNADGKKSGHQPIRLADYSSNGYY